MQSIINVKKFRMNKNIKLIAPIVILLSIVTTSCEKFSGDNDSISGSWRCRAESSLNGYSQYSVTIDKAGSGFDSTYYVIYNFHNQGYEIETYVQLKDNVITINDLIGGIASGQGTVSKDFKSIDWEYTISNDFVTAYYYRK